jgi:hypothetical protein
MAEMAYVVTKALERRAAQEDAEEKKAAVKSTTRKPAKASRK